MSSIEMRCPKNVSFCNVSQLLKLFFEGIEVLFRVIRVLPIVFSPWFSPNIFFNYIKLQITIAGVQYSHGSSHHISQSSMAISEDSHDFPLGHRSTSSHPLRPEIHREMCHGAAENHSSTWLSPQIAAHGPSQGISHWLSPGFSHAFHQIFFISNYR